MTTNRGDIKLMIERMISAKTEIGMLPVIDDAVELFEKLDAELEAIKELDLMLDKEQHRVELLEAALRDARPLVAACPQCRENELLIIDAALKEVTP